MGEQEVVFVQGPFQHCHSKESRGGGGRQECPLLGHCKVPGWPNLAYVAWVRGYRLAIRFVCCVHVPDHKTAD